MHAIHRKHIYLLLWRAHVLRHIPGQSKPLVVAFSHLQGATDRGGSANESIHFSYTERVKEDRSLRFRSTVRDHSFAIAHTSRIP